MATQLAIAMRELDKVIEHLGDLRGHGHSLVTLESLYTDLIQARDRLQRIYER